jgi:hypothetical protein
LEASSDQQGPDEPDERLLGIATMPGVLRDSGHLYKRNFLGLFTLFAPGMALVFIAGSLWVLIAANLDVPLLLQAGSIFWFLLFSSLIGSALILAAHALIAEGLVGEETNPRRALSALKADLPSVLQCVLLGSTGAMFFGVLRPLSLIFFVWWGPPLIGTTMVLENQSFPDAWTETRRRARGRLGRVILTLLLVAFLLAILGFALVFPILLALSAVAQTLFVILIFAIVSALVLPFMAAVELRLYFDLRARTDEGFGADELRAGMARHTG